MRRGVFLLVACLTAAPAYAQRVQTTDQVQHIICDSGCGQGGVGASVDISSVSGTVIVGGDVPVKFSTPQHVVVDTLPASGGGLTDTELRASPVSVTFTNTSIVLGAGGATIGAVNLAQYTPVSGRLPVDGSGVTQPVSHANFANLDAALSTLASQSTLVLIKAKTDNLDVLLSTRTKPADQQHAIIDSGSVTFTNASIGITGSVAVTGPLTDTQLRATPVPVSGTVTTGGLTDTQLRASNVGVSLAAETTKVIGTVNQGTSPWVNNVSQFGGSAVALGQATSANSIPVVLPSNWLPPPDRQATGTITAAAQIASVPTQGTATGTLTISGSFVGTLTFFGIDGASGGQAVLQGINLSAGTIDGSATSAGAWLLPTAGWSNVGVSATSWTSGTASIAYIASPGSNLVALFKPLPTGPNVIGALTSTATVNSTAPTKADLIAGADSAGVARVPLVSAAGVQLVQTQLVTPLGWTYACNAIRRTQCR